MKNKNESEFFDAGKTARIGLFVCAALFLSQCLYVWVTTDNLRTHLKQTPFVRTLESGTNSVSFAVTKGAWMLQITPPTNAVFSVQGTIRTSDNETHFERQNVPLDPHEYNVWAAFDVTRDRDEVHVDMMLTATNNAHSFGLRCFPIK